MKNSIKLFNKKFIYPVLSVFIFWYVLHKMLNSFIVPNPFYVLYRFKETALPKLLIHVVFSGFRLFISLSITIILGYFIGLFTGINEKLDNLISPILYLFFPIPRIAFLPVFMILFGLGDLSKIILIIAISIFQVIITTRDATKQIPLDLILSARSLNLSKGEMLKHIYIPATLSKLFTSIRIALGSSMAALFFAENYATKYGIGYFIMNSWVKVDYEEMYCGIIAISMLGIGLFKLIDIVQRKICKWESI